MKDKIEIPFGAKDSELCGFEYTIPKGMEAEIRDGKVIIRQKESEDERIRKEILECIETLIKQPGASPRLSDWIAWLEKQKDEEQRQYNLGVQAGREEALYEMEKQKEQKKIDACGFPIRDEGETACSYLERCLAPDMRKIWYDACAEIKQKERKPSTEETELNSIAFLEQLGYTCIPPGAEQKPTECDKETDIQKAFREGQSAGRQEVFDNPVAYGLEKIDNVFGFRIGDKVRLVDGDGRPHIIKFFEKIKGLHGPDFYRVVFEDNTASDHIIPGDEHPNGYFTHMKKIDDRQEQNPAEWSKEDRKMIERIIERGMSQIPFGETGLTKKQLTWLKDLPNRFYLHPYWKPSEAQMQWLESAVKLSTDKPYIHGIIISLYEQLKRL